MQRSLLATLVCAAGCARANDRQLMKSQTPHTARGQLYGVNAVTEALRAERRAIDGITIAEGARDQSLRQLIDLAREHKVPVKRAPRATLDRLARGAWEHRKPCDVVLGA